MKEGEGHYNITCDILEGKRVLDCKTSAFKEKCEAAITINYKYLPWLKMEKLQQMNP